MDEHDPRFEPDDEWNNVPVATWLWLALGIALFLSLLGCSEEYERQLRIQEWRDRFVNACLPRKGDRVTVEWVEGNLICSRITPTGRYGPAFPHVEVKVATMEDVEL